jgi:4-hydroxy-3-polyprenylbenzoate decarboxylase
MPPMEVSAEQAICNQNIDEGDDIDIRMFPAQRMWPLDGGLYLGTGDAVVTKDPETGRINVGTYRMMIKGPREVGVYTSPGKDATIDREKWWKMGKPMPIAAAYGIDPLLFLVAATSLPKTECEYDYYSGINGAPIEVFISDLTGLPLPARAEIVLEGFLYPDETFAEGPFGEFTGYYAAQARPAPVMEVTAVHHRSDPILLGSPPMKPPRFHFGLPLRAATIWQNLEAAGVTDVVGAWQHVSQLMTVVALKQRYDGHAKRAALIAAAHSYMARIVVVVDEDIDPANLNDVMWAVATRCEPSEQIDIIRNAWSSALDPRIPQEQKLAGMTAHSKVIIEACRPFSWLDKFPPASALSLEEAKAIEEKWGDFLK